jgi:predicted transcriptional regulator of viral defense system
MENTKIKQMSQKQMEIIAWLEFYGKYFFRISDVSKFFKDNTQRYNTIKRLMQKGRIIKLNKDKYYLIPIKAKSGGWAEDPFIVADEIFNGKDYFIGGWSAANYWRLTEQIPMKIEVYTTKRQGIKTLVGTKFIFRRTSQNRINRAISKTIKGHPFQIMNKREMRKWMKLRS